MESNAMNLTEYLAKWQELTERRRDVLTAVALGYRVAHSERHEKLSFYSPDNTELFLGDYAKEIFLQFCPHFTWFDKNALASFVEVWQAAESLNWKYWRPFEYVLSDRSAGIHQWVKSPVSKMNRAEILCCAYVWARMEEEPELWEKFEEAIG